MDARCLPTHWLKMNKTYSEKDEFDLDDDGKINTLMCNSSFYFIRIHLKCFDS